MTCHWSNWFMWWNSDQSEGGSVGSYIIVISQAKTVRQEIRFKVQMASVKLSTQWIKAGLRSSAWREITKINNADSIWIFVVEAISVILVHSRMQICDVPRRAVAIAGHSDSQSGCLCLHCMYIAVLNRVLYQFNRLILFVCTAVCTAVCTVYKVSIFWMINHWSDTRAVFTPTLGSYTGAVLLSQSGWSFASHHRPRYVPTSQSGKLYNKLKIIFQLNKLKS